VLDPASAVYDPVRLAAVHDTGLLDTGPEEPFDRLAQLAATLLDAPFAFITIVDDKRSYWKSCIGVDEDGPRQNAADESFCQYVVESREKLIVGDVARNPLTAGNPSITTMGVAAWAGFPVLSPTGEPLGSFCVVDTVVRTWTQRDEDILRVLALAASTEIEVRMLLDRERTAGQRAASEGAEAAARYDALLLSATEGIYGLDLQGNTTFGNTAALKLLGYTSEQLLGRDQHSLIHHSDAHGNPLSVEQCPIRRCLRSGVAQRSAAGEVFWRSDGTALPVSYTASPVLDGRQVVGAVVAFTDLTDQLEREHRLAVMDAERAALLELQQTLHPVRLEHPGVDVGVCYVPANGAAAGGDLHDWLLMPDGSLHLSVVDVVGKGVPAAKDALAVVHALRLLALTGYRLLGLVRAADGLLCGAFPDLAATVVIARLDPATGALSLVSGGHPPALLVRSGTATYLEPTGRALGWPEAGSDDVVTCVLEPGDALVLYTDGLVEARRDIVLGLQDLQETAATLSELSAQELADALVAHALGDADRVDDALAVVIRRLR
jgi:PAS domain S-box-containing protein